MECGLNSEVIALLDPGLKEKVVLVTGTNNPHGIGAAASRLDRKMPDFLLPGRTEDYQTDYESNDWEDAANEHCVLLPFTLPSTVDPEKIEANCAHGVLAIQMPKRAEDRAKQIKVNVPKSLKAA